jgi:hypothetical protein
VCNEAATALDDVDHSALVPDYMTAPKPERRQTAHERLRATNALWQQCAVNRLIPLGIVADQFHVDEYEFVRTFALAPKYAKSAGYRLSAARSWQKPLGNPCVTGPLRYAPQGSQRDL